MSNKGKKSKNEPLVVQGVQISSEDKVLFPDSGITKGQLASFYGKVSKTMLKELGKRPLSFVRCPADRSDCFFQKHLSSNKNSSVPAIAIKENSGKDAFYHYVDKTVHILQLAQINVIEFHQWGSKIPNPENPDRMIFDLDPGDDVNEEQIIQGAFLMRDLLKEIGLKSFPKVTGGKGVHVVVPLAGSDGWDEVKDFSKKIAEAVSEQSPDGYVSVSTKSKRKGKIFIDYLRNGRGATSIANFSVRARSGAPVAVPLEWSDLEGARKLPRFFLEKVDSISECYLNWRSVSRIRQSLPDKF